MAVEHQEGDVELLARVGLGVIAAHGLGLEVGGDHGRVHEFDLAQGEFLDARVGVP